MQRKPRRSAFTIIELLVVIAIIVLLIALLLPAVQKVREAMNIASCAHRMRQIGIGLNGFQNDKGALPPGGVDGYFPQLNIPNTNPTVRHGWGTFILPYIDQQPLYGQYRRDADFRDPVNRPVVTTHIQTFTCPTVEPAQRIDVFTSGGFTNHETSASDYSVIQGVNRAVAISLGIPVPAILPNQSSTMPAPGVMLQVGFGNPTQTTNLFTRFNRLVKASEIEDGASNTMVIAESSGRPNRYQMRYEFLKGSGVTSVGGAGWADYSNVMNIDGTLPTATPWAFPGGVVFPNNNTGRPINITNVGEIYAFHAPGANVLFADGSVRLITTRASLYVVCAMATRNGGERISVEDFD